MESELLNKKDKKKQTLRLLVNMEFGKSLLSFEELNMSSVSYVIPVFNKSKFLKPVINSLKSQNGSFEREYIFIDDGSTDHSYKILKKKLKH